LRRGIVSKLDQRLEELQRIKTQFTLEQYRPSTIEEFNERVGWPKHPKTGNPTYLYKYQFDVIDASERFILVVKSRKIGITEAIIRRVAQLALSHYAGFQVLLVSQREDNSEMMMDRLQNLFWQSPYAALVSKANKGYLKLSNGCEIFSLPSTAQSLRGFPRVKAVYLDEAAHFIQLKDENIYAALRPSIVNTQGDFVIVSTPRGQRGFFYKLYCEDNDFRKFVFPYTIAQGLISNESIEEERRALGPLFAQEYEAVFLSSMSAAFPEDFLRLRERDNYVGETL